MANPNLVNITSVTGHVALGNAVGTSYSTIVTNSSSSGKLYKINSINVANMASENIGAYVELVRGGTAYSLANDITVAAKSTLVVVTKDNMVYLNEGDSIRAKATADSIDVIISYDQLS